ncbi:hypothetical protein KI387_031103, partial [Taxus chinensis]
QHQIEHSVIESPGDRTRYLMAGNLMMSASFRHRGVVQLRKRYRKLWPSMAIKASSGKLKQQRRLILQQRRKMAWRVNLRRVRIMVKGFSKRVMRGFEGSRALLFHGATSTAANLIKSTSFFCHIHHRFHLMFLSLNGGQP